MNCKPRHRLKIGDLVFICKKCGDLRTYKTKKRNGQVGFYQEPDRVIITGALTTNITLIKCNKTHRYLKVDDLIDDSDIKKQDETIKNNEWFYAKLHEPKK